MGKRDREKPERPESRSDLEGADRIGAEIRESLSAANDLIRVPEQQGRGDQANQEDERLQL